MDLLSGYGSDDDSSEDNQIAGTSSVETKFINASNARGSSQVATSSPLLTVTNATIVSPVPPPPPSGAYLPPVVMRAYNAAPVPILPPSFHNQQLALAPSATAIRRGTNTSSSTVLTNNPLKRHLFQPMQGASSDPNRKSSRNLSRGQIGTIESSSAGGAGGGGGGAVVYDDVSFEMERTRLLREGVARAPDEMGSVIRVNEKLHRRVKPNRGAMEPDSAEDSTSTTPKKPRVKDILVENSDDELNYGIWGPPSHSETTAATNALTILECGIELHPLQQAERDFIAERDRKKLANQNPNDAEQFDRLVERKMSHLLPPRLQGEDPQAGEASTVFHGKGQEDYRGKSWMAAPPGIKCDKEEETDGYDDADGVLDLSHVPRSYVPKKCVGRLLGHNKGVHRIRLFPNTGHLLLSAGLEGKCKIWSVSQSLEKKLRYQCLRTYLGHSAAVRDVRFNNSGSQFASCSFDRFIRIWDTESGAVVATLTNRRVPYCVHFYPKDNDFIVTGNSDNKIVTYQISSGQITQEYNHHLAPVNAIAFCQNATKMVSTSDDKKVLIWEWDIGVPIKYISEPGMHSMPSITLHPNNGCWLGQGLDNVISVYQAGDRFALQRKKRFTGHVVAGYACEIGVSPDGRFVCSGDGEGRLFFWDWRGHKILQKYRAHDKGPTIGCVWHPLESSTVFTCGWDGIIKVWQ